MKKTTRSTAPPRHDVFISGLALTVMLLPGLVHPQAAAAQHAAKSHYQKSGTQHYGAYGGVQQNRTYEGAQQNRTYEGARSRGGVAPPARTQRQAGQNAPSRAASSPDFVPIPQPRLPPPPVNSIHSYPYTRNSTRYPLIGLAWSTYFPSRSAYYPYYSLTYTEGVNVPSMYYYYGTFPPYIDGRFVQNQPPSESYVPVPLYADGLYQGDDPTQTHVALAEPQDSQSGSTHSADAAEQDPLLTRAVADINTAWTQKDMGALSRHIYAQAPVAIYMKGEYCYSLDGDGYVNMTRDALSTTKTVDFTLDPVQPQGKGYYAVNGRHTYTDKVGVSHTVRVSYVLTKVDDDYFLAQFGSTPEKLEN